MDEMSNSGAYHNTCGTPVLATATCGSAQVKVEPLEQPPFPPSPLIRLIDAPVPWPSGGKLDAFSAAGTSSHVFPSAWSFPSYMSPCVPTYGGYSYAYGTPMYFAPYANQMALAGVQPQPAMAAPSFTPPMCADFSGPKQTRLVDATQEAEIVENGRIRSSPEDMDLCDQSTHIEVDDKPKTRDSSPPVLRTDSPRTIAYCYRGYVRGLEDATQKSDHRFASAGAAQGKITGVPVFIQPKCSNGALLEVERVDLFVAVSMIAGTAPSQYRLTPTGCLLVDMPSVEGVNRLLRSELLCGVEVKVSIPDAYQKSSSVIRGVPTSYTEDELLELLRNQGVIYVKRLVRYTAGSSAGEGVTREPTGKVVLTFPRKLERPTKVKVGEEEYKLREFVDRPARCYKCQRLGHVSRHCASKLRCKRCCGPHDIKECQSDRPRRCANCGGPHYPSYKGCRAYNQMLRSVKNFLNVT
ncbi:hypothetical protein HPB50_016803 [Hyalomma asiaticum]|uniref:Uncharacterized protein n=1 Tax=Hyalomma asiaticum TaxID=266040 RepID=A0ACB7SG77_HYAAI|nr:hypothetical protein HPB50_016803 [Hyalomma asiaticum]